MSVDPTDPIEASDSSASARTATERPRAARVPPKPASAARCAVSVRPLERRDPLEMLAALRPLGHAWMLDSASFRPGAGHSTFLGADPLLVLRSRSGRHWVESSRGAIPEWVQRAAEVRAPGGDVFDVIRRLSLPRPTDFEGVDPAIALPAFAGGWVGFLAYELARATEPVALHAHDDLGLPDLALLLVDRLIAYDAKRDRSWAIGVAVDADGDADEALDQAIAAREAIAWAVEAPPQAFSEGKSPAPRGVDDAASGEGSWPGASGSRPSGAGGGAEGVDSFDQAAHRAAVERIRSEIAAGEVYQANLTMRLTRAYRGDPFALYRELRRSNPAPFAAYLELPEVALVGSSPERFLSVDLHGRALSEPIKGTRPRGRTPAEDQALAEALSASEKDRAENLMIVDLVRNDLGKVCRTGSVDVPSLMRLESYATVHQLVSTVEGVLRSDRDAIDALRATFPPGSMTGAPKIAALRLIDRLEPVCRGIYSGALGYIDARGNADWAVVIRSAMLKDGKAHLNAGGGIVWDSDPDAEYAEALDKARALLAALEAVGR